MPSLSFSAQQYSFVHKPMLPISLPYIYKLSSSIRPLAHIEQGMSLTDKFFDLWNAETEINQFLTQSVYSEAMKASQESGIRLLGAIRALTNDENKDREISFYESFNIGRCLTAFETVLHAELNVNSAFWVSKKRGFDTLDLLNRAEVCFSPDLLEKVPECISDVRQAGRCIAFELPTAAGFHTMRATEFVMRQYYDIVTNNQPRPGNGNMGDLLNAMSLKDFGDAKVRACLRDIKDLHRNELMHPETSLDMNEAIELWGIAQSAITAMLRGIPGTSDTPLLPQLDA